MAVAVASRVRGSVQLPNSLQMCGVRWNEKLMIILSNHARTPSSGSAGSSRSDVEATSHHLHFAEVLRRSWQVNELDD